MLLPSSFHCVLGFLVLTLLSSCVPAPPNCELQMVAQMPLEVQDRLLVVPVGIGNKQVRMIVDTGAEQTTIQDTVAKQLKLPEDPHFTTESLGVGGTTTTTDVTVDRLVLGGVDFPLERIAVGKFKLRTETGLNVDGLLGADVLLAFDLDIDVPDGKLTLYRPRMCPQATLPWQEPAVEIAGVSARRDRMPMPFELDGVQGMAILDTGARRDMLGMDMAQRRLHLSSLTTMSGDPTISQRGVGPAEVIVHPHRFGLLRIGPVSEWSPELPVMESEAGAGDAIIGEDFLLGRRVWLSFRNQQIYVSLNSFSGR